MKISKFKLLNRGDGGVRIEAVEGRRNGNSVFLDKVIRERDVPVHSSLKSKLQELKYFYLVLTRHWVSPYNQYFDMETYIPKPASGEEQSKGEQSFRNIWNDSFITGFTIKPDGFVITGIIEVVLGKKVGIPTPYITDEDDYSFYIETVAKIEEIIEVIVEQYRSNALPDAESNYVEAKDDKATLEELTGRMLDDFQERGMIIMVDGSAEDKDLILSENLDNDNEVTLHNSGSIDTENIEQAEEVPDEKIEEKVEEKAEDVHEQIHTKLEGDMDQGTLASEKDFPDLGDGENLGGNIPPIDLADAEHSQSLGLEANEGDPGNKSKDEPWK